MNKTELIDRLMELAAKRFDKDAEALDPQGDFFELLGIDSFQAMELLTDLEEAFDVEIPDYELQGVNTFLGLAEIIERRL
ncbi:MAG: acyl carrier protein [Myxococcales bacterium]|nr:acyl carrier protein [Myxococcales bacterium]